MDFQALILMQSFKKRHLWLFSHCSFKVNHPVLAASAEVLRVLDIFRRSLDFYINFCRNLLCIRTWSTHPTTTTSIGTLQPELAAMKIWENQLQLTSPPFFFLHFLPWNTYYINKRMSASLASSYGGCNITITIASKTLPSRGREKEW